MAELYRTPLGHFRHETGHWTWSLLVAGDAGFTARFRARFGDERTPYAAALKCHYATGPPTDWPASHVSAYASVPLPFAMGFGPDAGSTDLDAVVRLWIDAALMLNGLNRSMGLPDPYPFVLNATVVDKLRFVHAELLARHPAG